MIVTDLEAAPISGIDTIVDEGVTSFKLFMAYPGSLMVDDGTIVRIMERAGKLGALVSVHAENGSVIELLVREAVSSGHHAPVYHALTRPDATEAEATHRAIALSRIAGVPVYIVHVSCDAALQEIVNARAQGAPVYAETCPQYLLRNIEDLKGPGFEGAKYVLTPPLREKWNQNKLWDGLKEDDLQVVATDHCPFNFTGQKDRGKESFVRIPNGAPGIEHRMELLFHFGVLERQFTLNRWIDITATSPARIFGLYPRKGTIAVGSDADIVVWHPEKKHTLSARTHHMRVDYSLYEGFTIAGGADVVLSRGEIIVEHGRWLGTRGRGKFLKRECFAGAWDGYGDRKLHSAGGE
jgi:dihydropyrimidinase